MSYVTHTDSRSPRRAWRAAGALLVALAVTLVWIGRASAQEQIAAGTRSISTQIAKADGVQTDIAACNNDQPGFVNVPEMLVSFKIAGTAPRAVIVLFEGEWFTFTGTPPTQARIRLSIDGIAQPEQVVVATELDEPIEDGTHGFNFVTNALAPGLHVARIQWQVSGEFCIGDRSLIVMHK